MPPGDVDAMRSSILGLLADPDRGHRLGEAARAYVERDCDGATYARRFAD